MSHGKEELFSEDQLHIILDRPDEVNPKHRSTHRERVESTVNNAVVQAIECFPALPEFMDPETKERLRLQTDPRYLTQPIVDIYPDQTAHAIAVLVLNEKGEDESDEEFLERLGDLWEDIERDVRQELAMAGVSFNIERTRYEFKRQLVERLTSRVYASEKWSLRMVVVSIREFVDWILDHEPTTEVKALPGILELLFDTADKHRKATDIVDYWDELATIASQQGISPPDGKEWAFDFANPTTADYERHARALDGLNDEIDRAVAQYMDEQRLVERANLVTIGLYHLSQLVRRDIDILESAPCSNTPSEWTSYDTRRANRMAASERILPLLDRTVTPKSGTDEKAYECTDLGEFVLWLSQYISDTHRNEVIQRDDIDEILPTIHLSELPQETMANAIDEISPHSDPTLWDDLEEAIANARG